VAKIGIRRHSFHREGAGHERAHFFPVPYEAGRAQLDEKVAYRRRLDGASDHLQAGGSGDQGEEEVVRRTATDDMHNGGLPLSAVLSRLEGLGNR
jgi:hypothetical protein